jgi:hypothetical protein
MTDTTHFIIEGVDRLGKGTLIKNIIRRRGYHQVIHYEKPMISEFYSRPGCDDKRAIMDYQVDSFCRGFELMLTAQRCPIIFDRFHLGETVYSPRYRGYDGDYVFELERNFHISDMNHVKLILLTTSNWDIVEDDGLSFDVTRREDEQEDFKRSFWLSAIRHKVLVDVSDEDGWRDPLSIADEAINMVTVRK